MCFILGAFSMKKEEISESQIKNVLDVARHLIQMRGRDSIGIYTRNSVGASTRCFPLKDTCLDDIFSRIDLPTQRCILIQSRAVPETELVAYEQGASLKNTQPFENVGWAVSHAGSIHNDKELRKEFPNVYWGFEPQIDSAILPYMFMKYGVVDTLKNRVEGSFAVAALDRAFDIFYLAKNFQPLYFGVKDDILYYSSLPYSFGDFSADTEMPAYSALEAHTYGIANPYISLYGTPPSGSVLVCLSSGLDSAVALRLYQILGYEVAALNFDYGQRAK